MVEATDPEAAAAAADRLVDLVEHAATRPPRPVCRISPHVWDRRRRPPARDAPRARRRRPGPGPRSRPRGLRRGGRRRRPAGPATATSQAACTRPRPRSRRSTPRCAAFPASGPSSPTRRPPSSSHDRVEQLTARFDALERELDDGLGATLGAVGARSGQRRAGRGRATRCGRSGATACAPPARSRRSRAPTRRSPRSRRSTPCRSRCRPSTASRCAAATPPGSTCSCAATDSTSTSPPSAGSSTRARPTRCSVRVRCAPPATSSRSSTRPRPRSASSATTPPSCAPPIRDDALLHLALRRRRRRGRWCSAHTRWASVGIISEANAHPLNHEELDGTDRPYVVGALNGDVDNYADLKALEGLQVPGRDHHRRQGHPHAGRPPHRGRRRPSRTPSARRSSELAGSMGIAAQTAAAPDRLLLSLRGSGQALYVGLVEDAYVVASEPYGLVEETSTYLRMDGETPADPERAAATRGQVVVLDAARAGTLAGIERERVRRHAAAGARRRAPARRDHHPRHRPRRLPALPAQGDLRGARRRSARRCGARSSSATVGSTVALGNDTLPESLRARLRDGSIRRVVVDRSGHGRDRRAEPRRRAPRRWPTTTCAPTRSSPPSSAASSCATT